MAKSRKSRYLLLVVVSTRFTESFEHVEAVQAGTRPTAKGIEAVTVVPYALLYEDQLCREPCQTLIEQLTCLNVPQC